MKQPCHITGEAYQHFRSVDNKWQRDAARLPNGALKEFLKKCKGLLGRLSLNLHIIHELSDELCGTPTPPITIPLIRVQQAAGIIEHLLTQIQTVHLQIAGESTQSAILAMINLSRKRQLLGEEGWLTARDVSLSQNAKGRMKSAEVRELMTKAVDMGYGELRGSDKRLEFRIRSDKVVDDLLTTDKKASTLTTTMASGNNSKKFVDDCRPFVDSPLSSETIVNTELQKELSNFVDDVDNCSERVNLDKTRVDLQTDAPVVNLDKIYGESSTKSTNQAHNSESIDRNSFEAVSQESTDHLQLSTNFEFQSDEISAKHSFEVNYPDTYKFKQGEKVSYQGADAEVVAMMNEKVFIDLGDRTIPVNISEVEPI